MAQNLGMQQSNFRREVDSKTILSQGTEKSQINNLNLPYISQPEKEKKKET